MCEVMEGGGESNTMSETVNCGELQEVADRKPKFCGKKERTLPPPRPTPPHAHWKTVEQRSKVKKQKKTVAGRIFLAFLSNLGAHSARLKLRHDHVVSSL